MQCVFLRSDCKFVCEITISDLLSSILEKIYQKILGLPIGLPRLDHHLFFLLAGKTFL